MKEDLFVVLTKDVANALLSYLGKRPFTEVSEIINKMMSDININASKISLSLNELAEPANVPTLEDTRPKQDPQADQPEQAELKEVVEG